MLFIISLAALLGGLIIGFIYQSKASAADRRNFPAPGMMVDVGGHRLHLQISGQLRGHPTVILEAGMASFSSNWTWVQQFLSHLTRVVSYDRAGLGWSDPVDTVRDARHSAEDLHTALQNAEIDPPYVLVGHSYGGLVVRAFRELYADEVVGIVLVDASHPDQWAYIPASKGGKNVARGNRFSALMARFGILRLMHAERLFGAQFLPEQACAEMKAKISDPQLWEFGARGLDVWESHTRPFINNAKPLGHLPLHVISVSEQPQFAETLTQLQNQLPQLSTNSLHEIVEGATHEDLVARREYALIVANAIERTMAAAQSIARRATAEHRIAV